MHRRNNIVAVTPLSKKIWLKWIMERVTWWVSVRPSPSFYWHWGVVPPKVQDLALGFVGLLQICLGPLLWTESLACSKWTAPLSLVSSAMRVHHVLRVHSTVCALSVQLTEISSRNGPCMDSWDTSPSLLFYTWTLSHWLSLWTCHMDTLVSLFLIHLKIIHQTHISPV